ncbi:DUF3048 domain-containing protein [Phototrophicus methaneseepsis]|uniref:DUF3048 domain-containing protein n=1 Tax=Phototrophicus methaneseepsis TaxID=2710758 RepID=A0A7S8E8B0_9CHLR|nr:DUF3048 domain-containing protein [Phototrophicus methaneseepsis]QPC82206.1 DUF3048 domain-containing protein [Phototrophicus methaneseepsis]
MLVGKWSRWWLITLMIGIISTGSMLLMTQAQTPISIPTQTPVSTSTPVPGAIGPTDYDANINPLTGLAVEDPSVLQRRPIIVKVSNSPALVRPQSGIGEADIAFEHYTEAGVTRFSGVFYSHTPQRVGSIRSARLIDYELVPMYQGLLAFAGASIGVDKRIYGSEYVQAFMCQVSDDPEQCYANVDAVGPAGYVAPSDFAERAYKGVLYGPPYFYRDQAIPIPHNLFANLDALWQLAIEDGNDQTPELSGLAFHETPQGTPTGSGIYAQVRYRTTLVEWHYDPETGRYYRSSDGEPHYDANTEQQISAANVIIVYAGHYLTDIVESQWEDTIHWSVQITVWPEGDAVILRDGVRYEGRWLRPTRDDLMTFQTSEGNILYLKPGNTWVQLVPLPDQMDPETEWVNIG